MDSKVKRGKFFLCELFIIVCLFFPWIVCALGKALSFLVWNIYTCFQNVWKGFVHGKYRPRTASKYVGSHCLKTQDKNNTEMAYGRKKNSSSNSESNEVGIRIHRSLGERRTYANTRFRRSEMVTNPTKLRARVFEDPLTGLRWPLIKPGPNESWRRRVYEDNRFRVSEKTRKSPFRARLRPEDPVTPLRWPVRRPGPVESWRCRNTPQMTNNKTVYKGRNNALFCKDKNKASAVRMQPPPVEELILRNDRNLLKSNSSLERNKVGIKIHRLPTERRVYEDTRFRVSETTREAPFRARLRPEDPVTPLRWLVIKPEPVESWRLKNAPQMTNNKTAYKRRDNALLCKDRYKTRIRMQSPPVEERILKNENFRSAEKVTFSSAHFPRQEVSDTNFEKTPSGEQSIPSCSKKNGSRDLKRKSKPLFLHFICMVKDLVTALLLLPRKMYTYVQSGVHSYNDIYGDSKVELPYTEPASVPYLKDEEGAPYISNPHVTFSNSNHDCADLRRTSANSEVGKSRNQSQGQNWKVFKLDALVRLIRELFCLVVSAAFKLRSLLPIFRWVKKQAATLLEIGRASYYVSKKQNEDPDKSVYSSHQAEGIQQTVSAHRHGAGPSVPHAVKPNVSPESGRASLNKDVNLHASSNIGMYSGPDTRSPSQYSHIKNGRLNSSSPAGRPTETHVKLSAESKAHEEIIPSSSLRYCADSASRAPERQSKTDTKTKKDVTQSLSPAHLAADKNVVTPASPIKEKAEEKALSRLTQSVPPAVKIQDQEHRLPAAVQKSQMLSTSVTGDSQVRITQCNGKSSAEEHIDVDSAARAPVRKRKTDAKTKKEVTKSISPAHVAASKNDTPAPPEEEALPRLTQSVPPRVKIRYQEQRLPAAAQKSQMLSTSVTGDSQVRITQYNGKSSAEEHIDVDSAARAPVRKRKTDTKTKKEVTQSISQGQVSARKDVVTPAPPIKEKAEENATPPITQSVPPGVKIQDQPQRLPAAAQKSQMLSASVTGDSQVRITQCNGKSSAEKHMDVDSAARDPVRKRKTEAKAKKEVTQSISPSHVAADIDAVTPALPVHEKAEEKAAPRLIQRAPARVKTQDQEHRLPGGAAESQVWPARGAGVRITQCNGSSSAEQHVDAEPPISRGKRAKSGDEHGQLRSWDLQASVVSTQDPIVEPRKVKRKAESDTGTSLKTRTTEFVRKQTSQVNRRTTAEQLDEMEVIESVELPCTGQEEPMELNGEENAVIFQSGWQSEAENIFKKTEPMDADQLLCENASLLGKLERDAMETNQECLSQEKSFGVWNDSIQPFLVQPAEEMETDHVPLPATPCFAQQQTMHSSLEPFTFTTAFGQLMDVKWPKDADMEITQGNPAVECVKQGNSFGVWADRFQSFFVQPAEEMETDHVPLPTTPCFTQQPTMQSSLEPFKFTMAFGQFKWQTCTDIEMPDADPTVQLQEAMDTSPVLFDACQPFKTVFGELADGKRPLASTVGVLKEESIPMTTPTAGQPVMEAAFKPITPPLARGTPPPLISRNVSPLVELLADSATPINSQHPQGMESALGNEQNFATIEQQLSVASEADPRPTSQLTMEQLQLVPGVSNIPDGLDSDSEDKPDDAKYELNLEQQLLVAAEIDLGPTITNRLTMEELQLVPEVPYTPDGSDSDSDSDSVVDSDDEYELDLETIDRFLELDTTPEHVQFINRLITQKELSSEQ